MNAPAAARSGDIIEALNDEDFMREALAEARIADSEGEVPVGAVLVMDGVIAARAHNSPISLADPTAHAEMLVLREAARRAANYRLNGAALYVTLEPCAMCAGALVNARVERLIFACRDIRFGAVRSKFRIADSGLLNHQVHVTEGVLGADCMQLMKRFFDQRR